MARGSPHAGEWKITVARVGTYRLEVRRWPREANAPITGVPSFEGKAVDAWTMKGGVEKLIYGNEMTALPVHSIQLEVGANELTVKVEEGDEKIVFELALKQGDTNIRGAMIDLEGNVIGGAYYVYVSRIDAP